MKKAATQLASQAFEGALLAAHHILRACGYQWELHRSGDVKVGIWRKSFRKKTLRKPIPARFVLIPGFGDTPLSWFSVVTMIEPVLRARFDEVILLDIPGYNGRLLRERFFPHIDELIEAVFDTLDYLKPQTVAGHSLGGFLAAQYAGSCSSGRRPNQKEQTFRDVEETIVIDPSGFFETEAEIRDWEEKMRRLAEEGSKFWRPFIFAHEPTWFKWLGDAFLSFIAREEIKHFLASVERRHEVRPALGEIKTKITLIWGEKDALFPSSLAVRWLGYLKNVSGQARAVLIRDCGHSPQIEAPIKTARLLGQVLNHKAPEKLNSSWYEVIIPV